MKHFITCESVTEGHPDKMCDQISDAILDACLEQDPYSRVACETMATTGIIIMSGEITTKANIDYQGIARKVAIDIGYDNDIKHFDGNNCAVISLLHKQSPDIAQGVDIGGAGDQGIMYGYATNETENYMPMAIYLAHKLAKRLAQVRKEGILPWVYPDGKTQVTVQYEDSKPVRVDTVVISTQHALEITHNEINAGIIEHVINPIAGKMIDKETKFYINPTGMFNIGGPKGDTGLTGRKIIVDSYGGIGRHGGGCCSGKDPTKVDRSGVYIMRYLAKNIVASGICDRCEIQVGYAIGVVQPVSVFVDCFGTEKVELQKIVDAVKDNFDLSSKGIIEKLDLRKPIFKSTAAYGHFGREEFTWEKLDSVDVFKKLLK
ncbi:MAG: methionine adenosyltransferase [candidate division SR1 bacterium CG_4_9_14_3_um_filter_40_9]|nr:MAG: methionine adenosyltransferase [candidate division SR1 bacterium CG_4_9_14_3_um_filter_40_9]